MIDRCSGIRELVESSIRGGLFPGAVWLVERRGDLISLGSAGHSQLVPVERSMSEHTIFDLASLTKPVVTGTLFMLFWERGMLDPEKPVGHYIPRFRGGWRDNVMLKQLLSHSSGLPSGLPLSKICKDPSEVLGKVCEAERAYGPGSSTLYSDVGFILMGKILERVSGRELDQLAREEVSRPLGMGRTMYNPPGELREGIAATQELPERGGILVGTVHDGNAYFMGGISGHAGLFSCAGDLAEYGRMMLGTGRKLVKGETIELATRIWSDDGKNAYGLSWFKRKHPVNPAGTSLSSRAFGHTGYTGTSIWFDPERELLAILLTNRVHPRRAARRIPEMNALRARFHDLAAGSSVPDPGE